jgi:uncharacterized membrane protein YqaE (UPF0057 family)
MAIVLPPLAVALQQQCLKKLIIYALPLAQITPLRFIAALIENEQPVAGELYK